MKTLDDLKHVEMKNYAHFDSRKSMLNVWDYISNPQNIKQHAFYPFISYEKNYSKYIKKNRAIKPKYRELAYSSHMDRCIYQYYGYLLNEKYNERVCQDNINNVAVAYRNNLHKSNIQFAKEAIDFIRFSKNCYIMVGDFKSFFDSLNHVYLKERLCNLLNIEGILPDDFYAIFKNITKYSTVRLEDIIEFLGLPDTQKSYQELNRRKVVMSETDFKKFKKQSFIYHRMSDEEKGLTGTSHKAISRNNDTKGIPQGSAISAVLANIYMLDFDKRVNDFVKQNKGLYMRYSDDFIVILPGIEENDFTYQYETIRKYIDEIPDLILESDKTQIFEYSSLKITNRNTLFVKDGKTGHDYLDYLGFTFDGKCVTLRDKTLSKYYYRMYHKAKLVRRWYLKTNRLLTRDLYLTYSSRGSHITKNSLHRQSGRKLHEGNFFSYVNRVQREFNNEPSIQRGVNHHMAKIKRALKKSNVINK